MPKNDNQESYWLERIAESIQGMKYGHIQITFHDGKLVQIDRTERKRFESPAQVVRTPINQEKAQ